MRRWLVIIFLFVCSPCWGADRLLNFTGFEEQSTLVFQGTGGSPAFDTSTPMTGTASLSMVGSATTATVTVYDSFDSGGVGLTTINANNLMGFRFKATDVTPSAQTKLFRWGGNSATIHAALALETSGDLSVLNAGGSTVLTVTAPFSINTSYYIELGNFTNDSGSGQLWIDGVSKGTWSATDVLGSTGRYPVFYGPGSGDGTYYFDDFYIMDDSADTAIPTPLAASSDGLEVFAYQGGNTGATADAGYTSNDTTLTVTVSNNTWNKCGETPWSLSGLCTYGTGSPIDGATVFNDSNSGGHGPGPSGGAYTIDGTIKGGKWSWHTDRGGGGGTTHYLWYGGSGTTPITSFSSDVDGDVLRAKVSEGADVPTSSEYFAMGFGRVGTGQTIEANEMMGEILHLPPAAAGTTGSALIWLSWVPEEERQSKQVEKFLNSERSEPIKLRMN